MYVLAPNQQVEKYPYSIAQLRKDNPNVSFPSNLSDEVLKVYNVFPVETSAQPAFDELTYRLVSGAPQLNEGVWTQVWTVVLLSAEERQVIWEQIKQDAIEKTQQRLDSFAQSANYDGIVSLCTYATCNNPKFRQEGQYGVDVRGATWVKLFTILNEAESGVRPLPSGYSEIESELPPLIWPTNP